MELPEIGDGQALQRLGRPAVGQAVRMEAVDEPVEHEARDVVRVVVADFQPRHRLPALPFELVGLERRVAGDVAQQLEAEAEAVLHDEDVDVGEVGSRARRQRAADRVDRVRDLGGRSRRRALIEQRGGQDRDALLLCRVGRGAGADQKTQRDDRLLVVLDDDHLHAVWQRADLVRAETSRRARPAAAAASRTASPSLARAAMRGNATSDDATRAATAHPAQTRRPACTRSTRPHCVCTFGMIVRTSRLVGVK